MSEKSTHDEYEPKAKSTFSAERKEDYFVLGVAAVIVALVIAGIIGPKFYNSLFFCGGVGGRAWFRRGRFPLQC